jgi:hypothetical protein
MFLAPLAATAPFSADGDIAPPVEQVSSEDAVFGGLSALDADAMSAASGGADTAIEIGQLGVNIADNDGQVSNVNAANSQTGQIGKNLVTDNHGLTTVFYNTGNGVVMQSNVNVNVFMHGYSPSAP